MSNENAVAKEVFGQILDSPDREKETDCVDGLEKYLADVDPRLVNGGWGFQPAKSVKHGKTDQSLVNHVRCGVFALARVNKVVSSYGGFTLPDGDLRDAIALFVLHDIHKLNENRDENPKTRFDIPIAEVEEYAERFGLYEFAGTDDQATLDRMFHACAVDHHDDWTANHDQSPPEFDHLRPFIRLADAFASSETPEQATDSRGQSALNAAYPGENFELRRHVLDDVKGLLTNLLNKAIVEALAPDGYEVLLVYQDGCVYLVPDDAPEPSLNDGFVSQVFDELKESVQDSHEAYTDPAILSDNFATRYAQNHYGINSQDFFYAGPETALKAVALKGAGDADSDEEPTDSMEEAMVGLEPYLPFEIHRTREPVGLARFVYTVKRSFVDPVLNSMDDDRDGLTATCDVFDVSESVRDGLAAAADDDNLNLTAGGKWDYAYGIGQALIEAHDTDANAIAVRAAEGLSELHEDWRELVEVAHAGNIRTELDAYLREIISVDGLTPHAGDGRFTDPFEEYGGSRRGKSCVLCNRGTTSGVKGDMEAPKSLTTLQAGYSNHIAVDAGKPDELLACVPCQIELSLRETGASRREAGRLFIHLVPDYFYTPLSWRSYTRFTNEFSGNSRTELGGLAKSILAIGDEDEEQLGDLVDALFNEEFGRSMVETLDQGFDPDSQFGARTLGYFKPKDNDTEFQFFGVFLALAIGAYAGLRVAVSESPILDIRGRDFTAYAHVGGGFTQVHDFYGSEVPLSALRNRLHASAALIRLGYGSDRNDALFAKYLRTTRNELLPGSHLLKRLAQADDSSDARYLLEEARVLDEKNGLTTDS
jgi:CRISPR-associated protein Csc3